MGRFTTIVGVVHSSTTRLTESEFTAFNSRYLKKLGAVVKQSK